MGKNSNEAWDGASWTRAPLVREAGSCLSLWILGSRFFFSFCWFHPVAFPPVVCFCSFQPQTGTGQHCSRFPLVSWPNLVAWAPLNSLFRELVGPRLCLSVVGLE